MGEIERVIGGREGGERGREIESGRAGKQFLVVTMCKVWPWQLIDMISGEKVFGEEYYAGSWGYWIFDG